MLPCCFCVRSCSQKQQCIALRVLRPFTSVLVACIEGLEKILICLSCLSVMSSRCSCLRLYSSKYLAAAVQPTSSASHIMLAPCSRCDLTLNSVLKYDAMLCFRHLFPLVVLLSSAVLLLSMLGYRSMFAGIPRSKVGPVGGDRFDFGMRSRGERKSRVVQRWRTRDGRLKDQAICGVLSCSQCC